jgi:hypothetical protein
MQQSDLDHVVERRYELYAAELQAKLPPTAPLAYSSIMSCTLAYVPHARTYKNTISRCLRHVELAHPDMIADSTLDGRSTE